jgi:hypothetical protein
VFYQISLNPLFDGVEAFALFDLEKKRVAERGVRLLLKE